MTAWTDQRRPQRPQHHGHHQRNKKMSSMAYLSVWILWVATSKPPVSDLASLAFVGPAWRQTEIFVIGGCGCNNGRPFRSLEAGFLVAYRTRSLGGSISAHIR